LSFSYQALIPLLCSIAAQSTSFISPTKMSNMFPLITDYTEVVPTSFTHEVVIPEGIFSPPNALRLVHHVGGLHPHFATNPYQFTIPGRTLKDAENFGAAMSAIVRWNQNRVTGPLNLKDSKPADSNPANPKEKQSVPRLNFFKLEFTCPCKGHTNTPLNSCKSKHISARCGCPARFSVSHHIESDSLWVRWFWKHNHDPYSHDDMVVTRPPQAVDDWLKARVEEGLSWKAIHKLICTPYISSVSLNLIGK
jgi:hypothetical protein